MKTAGSFDPATQYWRSQLSTRSFAPSVQPHRHGAGTRNQQRKAIDLKLAFKIAAELVEPFILRLVSELFALRRAFASGAGLLECRKRRIPWQRQRSQLQEANDRANHPT
jgi:hypothetical protein